MRKLTTEQFIERARAMHGDRYDYSKVEYRLAGKDVEIVCQKHGGFFQRPANHLSGKGCSVCALEAKYNNPKVAKELPPPEEILKKLVYDRAKGKLFHKSTTTGAKAGEEAGCINTGGYRLIRVNRSSYLAGRLILALEGRAPSVTERVDHINGVRDDNRIENLRVVTDSENSRNTKLRVDNKTGYHGITITDSGKYLTKIDTKKLGIFSSLASAVAARKAAEQELEYHKNHGRVVTKKT